MSVLGLRGYARLLFLGSLDHLDLTVLDRSLLLVMLFENWPFDHLVLSDLHRVLPVVSSGLAAGFDRVFLRDGAVAATSFIASGGGISLLGLIDRIWETRLVQVTISP